jgi:hypothetical protein
MHTNCSSCKTLTRISNRYKGKSSLCEKCLTYKNSREKHREEYLNDANRKKKLVRSKARGSEWFKAILRARYVLSIYDTINVTREQYIEDCQNKFLNGRCPIVICPPKLSEADMEMLDKLRCGNHVNNMIARFKWREYYRHW